VWTRPLRRCFLFVRRTRTVGTTRVCSYTRLCIYIIVLESVDSACSVIDGFAGRVNDTTDSNGTDTSFDGREPGNVEYWLYTRYSVCCRMTTRCVLFFVEFQQQVFMIATNARNTMSLVLKTRFEIISVLTVTLRLWKCSLVYMKRKMYHRKIID